MSLKVDRTTKLLNASRNLFSDTEDDAYEPRRKSPRKHKKSEKEKDCSEKPKTASKLCFGSSSKLVVE